LSGSEIPRFTLLEVLRSGQLRFEAIEPVEARVRLYGETAVITGRTQMHGHYGDAPFITKSRYTHVFVEQQGQWRLVAAQGTQISGE
jgi:ketosteroid isomerase-like protein